MKIGCHCVLFGSAIATDTDQILSDLAKTGCSGVELGARFFNLQKSAELKASLERNGLALAGLHTVVQLVQLLDKPEESRTALASVAEAIGGMPQKNIIVTGMVENKDDIAAGDARLKDPAQIEEMVMRLDGIAGEIKAEYGAQIHYHNHSWEFQNNGLIYQTLLRCAKNLRLCLDTGWANISGFDPVTLMEERSDVFSYTHLRDCKAYTSSMEFTQLQETAFTDLGEGAMDYRRLMRSIRDTIGNDGWAVIEYKRGVKDYMRYTQAVKYVKGILEDIR